MDDLHLHQQQSSNYMSYFGLPYPDHTYSAFPPPSPPLSPRQPVVPQPSLTFGAKVLNVQVDPPNVSSNKERKSLIQNTPVKVPEQLQQYDESITRCICNFEHDDGYMICCDKCGVWQHVICMEIDRNNIPDNYSCELCEPRPINKLRAIKLQSEKRALLKALDTSATETEDETKSSPTQKQIKSRRKKQINRKEVKRKRRPYKTKERGKTRSFKNKRTTVFKRIKQQKNSLNSESVSNASITEDINEPVNPPVNSPPKPIEKAPPWYNCGDGDSYEEALSNRYSIDIDALLIMRKGNNSDCTDETFQLLDRLVNVANVADNHKGLEAATDISSNQAMLEYRGTVMLWDHFDKRNQLYQFPQPYVLIYSKFESTNICIDATAYGNEARFIRRSCSPNSEVRHVVENGTLKFIIFSTKCIPNGTEVTIAFDFNFQQCTYKVLCACMKTGCQVLKYQSKHEEKAAPAPSSPLKGYKKRRSRTQSQSVDDKSPPTALTEVNTFEPVDDQSEPSVKRKTRKRFRRAVSSVTSPSKTAKVTSPIKVSAKRKATSEPTTPAVTNVVLSATDTESDAETEKKKMSREERKLAAIMKAFEKLDKRQQRRKEALARLGKEYSELDVPENVIDQHIGSNAKDKLITEQSEQNEIPVANEILDVPVDKNLSSIVEEHEYPNAENTTSRLKSRLKPEQKSHDASLSCSADSEQSADGSNNQPLESIPTTPISSLSDRIFKFPKTKKHFMNEWFNEKSMQEMAAANRVDKTCDTLEIQTNSNEEAAEFVRCIPSPQNSSFKHLRRSSSSSAYFDRKASHVLGQPEVVELGSAKKRWLRQAMSEKSPVKPEVSLASPVPSWNASIGSPDTSSADFVTPLKKRRIARESRDNIVQDHFEVEDGHNTFEVNTTDCIANLPETKDNLFEKFEPPPIIRGKNTSESVSLHSEKPVHDLLSKNVEIKVEKASDVNDDASTLSSDPAQVNNTISYCSQQHELVTTPNLQENVELKTDVQDQKKLTLNIDSNVKVESPNKDSIGNDCNVDMDSNSYVKDQEIKEEEMGKIKHETSVLISVKEENDLDISDDIEKSSDHVLSIESLKHEPSHCEQNYSNVSNVPDTINLKAREAMDALENDRETECEKDLSGYQHSDTLVVSEMPTIGSVDDKLNLHASVLECTDVNVKSDMCVKLNEVDMNDDTHEDAGETNISMQPIHEESEKEEGELSSDDDDNDDTTFVQTDNICDDEVSSTKILPCEMSSINDNSDIDGNNVDESSKPHEEESNVSSSSFSSALTKSGHNESGVFEPTSTSDTCITKSPVVSSTSQQCKKKVSLAEYRNRKKHIPSKSFTHEKALGIGKRSNVRTLEEVKKSFSPVPESKHTQGLAPLLLPPSSLPEEWNVKATAAEQMREQTQLSLTERLRKEFGLDAASDSENDKDSSDDEPPPPPPRQQPSQPVMQHNHVNVGLHNLAQQMQFDASLRLGQDESKKATFEQFHSKGTNSCHLAQTLCNLSSKIPESLTNLSNLKFTNSHPQSGQPPPQLEHYNTYIGHLQQPKPINHNALVEPGKLANEPLLPLPRPGLLPTPTLANNLRPCPSMVTVAQQRIPSLLTVKVPGVSGPQFSKPSHSDTSKEKLKNVESKQFHDHSTTSNTSPIVVDYNHGFS